MSSWKVPYRDEKALQLDAAQFRKRFGVAATEKVLPIEAIVDVEMEIDIVPLPGLYRITDSWGALSPDCSSISVDEMCCTGGYEEKYRFTLAHEVAHRELHAEIFRELEFSSVMEFKDAIGQHLSDAEYGSLEWQADYFAGCILVPGNLLREEFGSLLEEIQNMLAEWQGGDVPEQRVYELALIQICEKAGDAFAVSPVCIDTRLHCTGLKEELPKRLFGAENHVEIDDMRYRDLPN